MSEVLPIAFPASLRGAASNVVAELQPAASEPAGRFSVCVEGEMVEIPQRIYNAELPEDLTAAWPQVEQNVYACLYTRHIDGHKRQHHLRKIVSLTEDWVSPFVVQLVGEYVVEILTDIQRGLSDLDKRGSSHQVQYARFVAANPRYLALTAARVISYWNCYYRLDYPKLVDYPGYQLMSSLKATAVHD